MQVATVNGKHQQQYDAANHCNYLSFTDLKDALPLNKLDRRWWVISCEIEDIKDLPSFVGLVEKPYFKRLYDELKKYSSEVHLWLLQYPITKGFRELTRAPSILAKDRMIVTEEACTMGLLELKEIIEEGRLDYVSPLCLDSSILFKALDGKLDLPQSKLLSIQDKSYLLKKLGYSFHKQMKIQNVNRRIWIKHPMSNNEIRQHFVKIFDENSKNSTLVNTPSFSVVT